MQDEEQGGRAEPHQIEDERHGCLHERISSHDDRCAAILVMERLYIRQPRYILSERMTHRNITTSMKKTRKLAIPENPPAKSEDDRLMDRLLASGKIASLIKGAGIFIRDYTSDAYVPSTFWKELGYAADDLRGDKWKDIVHPDDRQLVEGFDRLLARGEADSWNGTFRLKGTDGAYRQVSHKALVLERTAEGTPSLFVGWDVDVTAFREREAALSAKYEDLESKFLRSEELRAAEAILTSELDPVRAAERVLVQAERVVSYDAAAVWTLEDGELFRIAGIGFDIVSPGRRGNPVADVPGRERDRVLPFVSARTPKPFLSRLEVPLMIRDRVIGYLVFYSRNRNAYANEDVASSMLFAEHAGMVLSNALKFQASEREAATDWLTGLPTRRAFMSRAARLCADLPVESRLAVLMIDIDWFKHVNDQYGHCVGDEALVAVSSACREALRSEDLICRYGGEEIVVMLPGADERTALAAAERVRVRIVELRLPSQPDLRLTVSVGVDSGMGTDDFREIISRADEALYMAKESGRNRCELR
ncbi:MAG TPA: hypothetical protein DIC34_07730 [Treponema sp.]|nr:hypothetical protein [Treponema sp.]